MSKTSLTTQKTEIRALMDSDEFREQIAKAIPAHLTPDRFLRVALTAMNRNPKLFQCTRESLFQCMLDCSAVGLEPDGRHAHLIPYGKDCTLIIDYKGLLAMARRNGVSADAKVVREADAFTVREDDGTGQTTVEHSVAYRKPRGELVCVYSRASWAEGDQRVTSYEVMTREEIDAIRGRSRAGNSGPWVTDFDEMARKTVLRRHSKRWPMAADMAAALDGDHDTPDFSKQDRFAAAKPVFGEALFGDDAPEGAEPQSEKEVAA